MDERGNCFLQWDPPWWVANWSFRVLPWSLCACNAVPTAIDVQLTRHESVNCCTYSWLNTLQEFNSILVLHSVRTAVPFMAVWWRICLRMRELMENCAPGQTSFLHGKVNQSWFSSPKWNVTGLLLTGCDTQEWNPTRSGKMSFRFWSRQKRILRQRSVHKSGEWDFTESLWWMRNQGFHFLEVMAELVSLSVERLQFAAATNSEHFREEFDWAFLFVLMRIS